jgi:acyl carrier protein phosphodiesterase
MNWLAHLRLAPEEPLLRLGNLCGDFVRGVDISLLPLGLQRGIAHHRAIDRFVDAHPIVRTSRARLGVPFQRLAPVLLDVFYDHFLARDWQTHGDGRPLASFAAEVHDQLEAHASVLPPRLQAAIPVMRRENWLLSYAQLDGIDAILLRMSRRLTRPNPLAKGGQQLRAHHAELAQDFALF